MMPVDHSGGFISAHDVDSVPTQLHDDTGGMTVSCCLATTLQCVG